VPQPDRCIGPNPVAAVFCAVTKGKVFTQVPIAIEMRDDNWLAEWNNGIPKQLVAQQIHEATHPANLPRRRHSRKSIAFIVSWYTGVMIKLTRELTEQALQHPDGFRCQGDGVDKTFVIIDAEVMRQMQEAIARNDLAAIQAGIDDMEAGRMQSAEEAHHHGREELVSRYKK